MKFIFIPVLVILSGCSFLPFLVEEVEQGIEFEEDAVKHEFELRNLCKDKNKK